MDESLYDCGSRDRDQLRAVRRLGLHRRRSKGTANGAPYRGVRQQFVKLEGARGNRVGVVSGVNPGEEIVTSGVFKLRNGGAVVVNNKVQPANSPTPKPEDNYHALTDLFVKRPVLAIVVSLVILIAGLQSIRSSVSGSIHEAISRSSVSPRLMSARTPIL